MRKDTRGKSAGGGPKCPGEVSCWDRLRRVQRNKRCCKWNPPSLRRLHCCHRLIKVVSKCTQTCRQTFLEGVLAVRSTFSASLSACYVREGCFLRSCPRHSCGGTEMLRVLLMHSTLLLSWVYQEYAPKGKSFLTGVGLASRQSQTSVL